MERWFILMGIKYANSLGLSIRVSWIQNLFPSLQHSLVKKMATIGIFFIKYLLKRGNQVYLVKKGCLFVNVLLIIEILHPF